MKIPHQMIYDVFWVLTENAFILPRTKAIGLHLDGTMRCKEFQERRDVSSLKSGRADGVLSDVSGEDVGLDIVHL